jgi:hypothetical protein
MTPSPTPTTGAIEGWVFHDANDDLVFDPDERGLTGAVLELIPVGGELLVRESDDNGYFRFDNLLPGIYTLQVLPPDGWEPASSPSRVSVLVTANHTHRLSFAHRPAATSTPTPSSWPVWLPLYWR